MASIRSTGDGQYVLMDDDAVAGFVTHAVDNADESQTAVLYAGLFPMELPFAVRADNGDKHQGGLIESLFVPTPPQTIQTITVSSNTIHLRWDSGFMGLKRGQTTSDYQIRFSTAAPILEETFDTLAPAPGAIHFTDNQWETILDNLQYNTIHRIAVKALDNSVHLKNRSFLSQTTVCTLGPTPTNIAGVFSPEMTAQNQLQFRMNTNNPLGHTLTYAYGITSALDDNNAPDYSPEHTATGTFTTHATDFYTSDPIFIGDIGGVLTTYHLRLTVQNLDSVWAPYEETTMTFNNTKPSLLAVDLEEVFESSAVVRWNAAGVSPGTTFDVETSTDNGVSWETKSPPYAVGSSSHALVGLEGDQIYKVRLQVETASHVSLGPTAVYSFTTKPVPPGASELSATVGDSTGTVTLAWESVGDNGQTGLLTGTYRIQYSTNPDTAWDPTETPVGATTLEITADHVTPRARQTITFPVPSEENYYAVLYTKDEIGTVSPLSNVAQSYPSFRTIQITLDNDLFGPLAMGQSSISQQAVTITNEGTVPTTYQIKAEISSEGSEQPWVLGSTLPTIYNTPVLMAVFHNTAPTIEQFGVEDILGDFQRSNGSRYSVDGTQTGENVPPGETRTLWLRIDMPSTAYKDQPLIVTLSVTAGP